MAARWTREEEKTKYEELLQLYVRENKTIFEIAEILGIAYQTVYDRLIRLKILTKPVYEPPFLSKRQIETLYYQRKLSTSQIAKEIGADQWRIISFMRRNRISRRTSAESNNINYLRQKPSFNLKTQLSEYEEKLKNVACALYWGEGAKGSKHHTIDLANSDPDLILVLVLD